MGLEEMGKEETRGGTVFGSDSAASDPCGERSRHIQPCSTPRGRDSLPHSSFLPSLPPSLHPSTGDPQLGASGDSVDDIEKIVSVFRIELGESNIHNYIVPLIFCKVLVQARGDEIMMDFIVILHLNFTPDHFSFFSFIILHASLLKYNELVNIIFHHSSF